MMIDLFYQVSAGSRALPTVLLCGSNKIFKHLHLSLCPKPLLHEKPFVWWGSEWPFWIAAKPMLYLNCVHIRLCAKYLVVTYEKSCTNSGIIVLLTINFLSTNIKRISVNQQSSGIGWNKAFGRIKRNWANLRYSDDRRRDFLGGNRFRFSPR